MTYYIYNEQTKGLMLAPRVITMPDGSHVANPTAAQYAAIGAYPIADDPEPTTPEGKVAVPDGYELRDNAWHRVWRYEDAPPAPKPIYSKYKLALALESAGLLETFMAFIGSDPVLAFKWGAATQLDYDDDTLSDALAEIKASLGVTDEQLTAILAAAEV